MTENKPRLTQMVKSAGCAAKIFPHILSDALKGISWETNENVLVGFEGKDDAGVYKISDELALIHTTDFFTPVVDDPYTFGQIAVTNALSDIYAMGGTPINGLNIVAFPQVEDLNILKEILQGGCDKAREAGCVIIGGHSVDIPTILYGMAVTGTIHPQKVKGNNSANPGDVLILTKGLGTGILNNMVKFSELEDRLYKSLIWSVTRLNKSASMLMQKYSANACTDITGFGLAGHSMQLAAASGVTLHINVNKLPILDGAMEGIKQNFLTRGDKSNREYTKNNVSVDGTADVHLEHLLYDPQTSGGLLISVPEENAEKLLKELIENGDNYSRIIGSVSKDDPGKIIFMYK